MTKLLVVGSKTHKREITMAYAPDVGFKDSEILLVSTKLEAAEALKTISPPFAVVDMYEPADAKGEGYEIIGLIREKNPQCRIICLIAANDAGSLARTFLAGADIPLSTSWKGELNGYQLLREYLAAFRSIADKG